MTFNPESIQRANVYLRPGEIDAGGKAQNLKYAKLADTEYSDAPTTNDQVGYLTFFLRADNYAEYSSITYLDIIGVLVNLGGLASALFGPLGSFMDHIASESYINRIVAGLYTRRQKMPEFLETHTNLKP